MKEDILASGQKFHFIGIGGAGMSGIAKVLLEMGEAVSGSDLKESRHTAALADLGATVSIGHDAANLGDAGVVVISSAIPETNPELTAARERGLNVMPRARMLAQICRQKPGAVAVGGTHGKTTTTSMTALILDKAGLSPTFLIGGELNDIGGNAKYGDGESCVVEADESDGSLVYLAPKYAIVTNIDSDHLDYHGTFDNLVALFSVWLSKLPADGKAIVLGDGSPAEEAARTAGCSFITFGRSDANDLSFSGAVFDEFGSQFSVHDNRQGRSWRLSLRIPGEHNILNALAALAASQCLGLEIGEAGNILAGFSGVKRRFQLVGRGREVAVVDDYAHHPTEVTATLAAAGQGGWNRVICVFQPHRFTRTKLLSGQFGGAFGAADITVMTDIYNAGEMPIPGVNGKLLVDEILAFRPRSRVTYIPDKMEIKDYLLSIVRPGDIVLTVGAGDIWTVGVDLFEQLKEAGSLT
ncbi:MAG: UDP-N-acetylmuramate--L-alanine ligase [Actinomycetota bacterium]|nr:UDP-N-acetylmuramate--L-alanine ligase [Actinomycetota bacterium]